MAEHPRLYEIIQKVWNAGREHEAAYNQIIKDDLPDGFPAAYPVITPLIEELVVYVDEQIDLAGPTPQHLCVFNDATGNWDRARIEDLEKPNAIFTTVERFGRPFRSVEIEDGKLVE